NEGDDIGGPAQRAVLQDRFGRQRLQQRSGNNAAVWNAEAIAELKGGAADDDLLVPELGQRGIIAAQYIDVGHSGDRRGTDTEIDQERLALRRVLPGQYGPHRRQKLAVELLAKRVAADKAIRFDGDIHDGGPCVIAELFQRTIDMDRRSVAALCP